MQWFNCNVEIKFLLKSKISIFWCKSLVNDTRVWRKAYVPSSSFHGISCKVISSPPPPPLIVCGVLKRTAVSFHRVSFERRGEEEKPDDKVKVYAEIHDIITTQFSSPLLLEAEDDFFPSRVCVCDCVWGYSTSSDTKMSIIDFGIDDSCHGMSYIKKDNVM